MSRSGCGKNPSADFLVPSAAAPVLFLSLLREELGIDITSIFKDGSRVQLRLHGGRHAHSDLSGPIVFILGLGFSHMLASLASHHHPHPPVSLLLVVVPSRARATTMLLRPDSRAL